MTRSHKTKRELAAEMVGGFELNTEGDHCVASWVPHRNDKT